MSSGPPIENDPCKQPAALSDDSKWIHMFGDVNFIEYGGQLLVPDDNGVSYLEVIVPPSDDETSDGDWQPNARWTVYQVYMMPVRWTLDRLYPVATCDEWFYKDLDDVASYVGRLMREMRNDVCSSDPVRRAEAYIAMAAYWCWYEFDQYPLVLTQHGVYERYGLVDECGCVVCELHQQEELNSAAMCDWKALKGASQEKK